MPQHYNSTCIRYVKKQERKENDKRERKQERIEAIRGKVHQTQHVGVGNTKPPCGKIDMVKTGIVPGIRGWDPNCLSVGEVLHQWAPGCKLSDEPVKDKNHLKINKMATRMRATTAKA